MEDRAAKIPAVSHRHPGADVDRRHRTRDLTRRDGEHDPAHREDVPGVTGGDAAIDDVAVDARQEQRRRGRQQLQDDDRRELPCIRLQVTSEQTPQHRRATYGIRQRSSSRE